jgi:hypothetical protein
VGDTVADCQWAWTLDGVMCLSRLQSDCAGTEGDGLWLVQTKVDVRVQVSVGEPNEGQTCERRVDMAEVKLTLIIQLET